jgi:hypothetical protein
MMTELNLAMQKLAIPFRMRKLPIDERGYPVPKFVQWVEGKPDFRVVDIQWLNYCVRHKPCWLCGERLGSHMAFCIGPMCAVNRVNSEPPSHLECARFAVQACPFMTHPNRKRNEMDLPIAAEDAAGITIDRNPGVTLIWVTKEYKVFQVGNGLLFGLGEPEILEWWAKGRPATREEILHSINTGLPTLQKMAEEEGPKAVAALEKKIRAGLALVPA